MKQIPAPTKAVSKEEFDARLQQRRLDNFDNLCKLQQERWLSGMPLGQFDAWCRSVFGGVQNQVARRGPAKEQVA